MRFFSVLIIILLLFGCSGPITYTKLSNENYPPKNVDNIKVYIDETPNKKFTKTAIISTNMWKENLATNIKWIKTKAAELGADAIILFRADPHSSGESIVANSFVVLSVPSASGYNYSAYAVKFTEE
jgi:hypothetical protein